MSRFCLQLNNGIVEGRRKIGYVGCAYLFTVYLPGELEFITERDSNESGVPIDERSVEKLLVLADNQNINFPSEI